VAFLFVPLHYRAGGNFLGPLPVTAGALRLAIDMLVLAALLTAYTSHAFSSWHVASSAVEDRDQAYRSISMILRA
jgi:hypothetical protein